MPPKKPPTEEKKEEGATKIVEMPIEAAEKKPARKEALRISEPSSGRETKPRVQQKVVKPPRNLNETYVVEPGPAHKYYTRSKVLDELEVSAVKLEVPAVNTKKEKRAPRLAAVKERKKEPTLDNKKLGIKKPNVDENRAPPTKGKQSDNKSKTVEKDSKKKEKPASAASSHSEQEDADTKNKRHRKNVKVEKPVEPEEDVNDELREDKPEQLVNFQSEEEEKGSSGDGEELKILHWMKL